MNWFWRLVCKWRGHDMSIVGLTGRYLWCKRCAHRIDLDSLGDEDK